MKLTIAPSALHEITKRSLLSPADLERFGRSVIACCLASKPLFDLANICVNFDALQGEYARNDFLDPVDGFLFGGVQDFARCWIPGNPWPTSAIEWAQAVTPHFHLYMGNRPDFPSFYLKSALERLMTLPPAVPGDYDRVCDGLVDYIHGVRYYQLELNSRQYDPARRRETLEAVPLSVRIPGMEVAIRDNESIMNEIFSVESPIKPFFTGIRSFDQHYGGRAQGGDAWLVFTLPGGGKTNFGCQSTGHTAKSGRLVLYVTTEVKPATLLIRIASSTLGIPYKSLQTLRGSGGSNPYAATFREWLMEGPGRGICIQDYREVAGADYREKHKRMLDACYKKYGRAPDLQIWDWIGKALDSGFKDSWQKREAYNGVAAMMVGSADELDGATITLAQADKIIKNRSVISDSDTADSHSLSDGMEGAAAFTCVMEQTESNSAEQDQFKAEQTMVICKCREEHAMRLGVRRCFDKCRFESY